jgi:hypothetical protein
VLLAAVLLLVVTVGGALCVGAYLVHRHHEHVAALHRNPSYKYGYSLNIGARYADTYRGSRRSVCESYVASHPAHFGGFDPPIAVEGCLTSWADAASY